MVLHKRKYHSLRSERHARFVHLEAVRAYQRLDRGACMRALMQARTGTSWHKHHTCTHWHALARAPHMHTLARAPHMHILALARAPHMHMQAAAQPEVLAC